MGAHLAWRRAEADLTVAVQEGAHRRQKEEGTPYGLSGDAAH